MTAIGRMEDSAMKNPQPLPRTIGILTALPEDELPAVLRAFGIDPKKEPDRNDSGDRYWLADLSRKDGASLKIVISCIAGSGNAEPQIPTERLIAKFAPEAMFFVGIACGLRSCNLGDVVTSEVIWGYEYVKTSQTSNLDRSRAWTSPAHLTHDVEMFKEQEEWQEHFRVVMARLPPAKAPRLQVLPRLHPSVWIASGEKVMGNGELTDLNKRHDKIRAGEMEGWGFAVACEQQRPRVPWLVVRGISDYGDVTKDGQPPPGPNAPVPPDAPQTVAPPTNAATYASTPKMAPMKDEYHLAAAAAAATFLSKFLEHTYSPVRSGEFTNRDQGTTGTLNDRQIITMASNGILIAEDFAVERVKQACYELRAGDCYYELRGKRKRFTTADHGFILLKPRQLTVIITKESLNMPEDILGRILTKGKLFSVGILPVNTYADPGFQGRLGIVLYNATPKYLRVNAGEPIAKIEFSRLAQRVEKPYSGQHGYQTEIWPIPEEIVLTDAEAAADPRVDSRSVELERAYGQEIAQMVVRTARAHIVSLVALVLACIACVLGLWAAVRR